MKLALSEGLITIPMNSDTVLFNCPQSIRQILVKLDLLGYDTLEECANALLADKVFAGSYDIENQQDIEAIMLWIATEPV